MSAPWRIIETGALEPSANMAFDEAILRGYQRHCSPPTLRIYGWKRPGISLGYSQNPKDDLDIELCRKKSMPFVRRITGGGIILHNNEITYSLVCSKEDLGLPGHVSASYKIISSFLIAFYSALGIKAEFACDAPACGTLGIVSALCFAAKEKYDIVSNGRKIGGSAQKRSRGVIFQHGSIPLSFDGVRASSFLRVKAPDTGEDGATCLEELRSRYVRPQELSQLLIKSFMKSFNVKAETLQLSDAEERSFVELKRLKYESADWNLNRIDGALS